MSVVRLIREDRFIVVCMAFWYVFIRAEVVMLSLMHVLLVVTLLLRVDFYVAFTGGAEM